VLSNTINSFEMITSRKLSQGSGQFDDAILSWGSGSGLVRDAETARFRQIEVGVGLFKCGHDGRWDRDCAWCIDDG
jgi:hypothetical protein